MQLVISFCFVRTNLWRSPPLNQQKWQMWGTINQNHKDYLLKIRKWTEIIFSIRKIFISSPNMTDVCCTGLITCPRQTWLIFSYLIFSSIFSHFFSATAGVNGHTGPAVLCKNTFNNKILLGYSSLPLFSAREQISETNLTGRNLAKDLSLCWSYLMRTSNSFLLIQIRANDWQ